MGIRVEIRKIDNGWIVNDDYYGEETFCDSYDDAASFAKKIFTRYRRDEVIPIEGTSL